jgi:hypothetical protein
MDGLEFEPGDRTQRGSIFSQAIQKSAAHGNPKPCAAFLIAPPEAKLPIK